MNRRRVSLLLAGAVVLGGLTGCRCANGRRVAYVPPPPGVGGPCDRWAAKGPLPPRFAPPTTSVVPVPPPPAVAAPPPGAVPVPPGTASPPPGPANSPRAGAIQQNGYAPPGPSAPPASSGVVPGVYLEQPEPAAPEPAKLMPNDAAAPAETRPYTPPQTPEPPPARDDRAASPDLPVDIPHFTMVKTDIANGQEPFPEGVAWLKAHNYRTVLHIQAPGADDSAARRRFEQSGLRYLRLEVSPQTLSRAIVEQFNRLVADANNLPLFVYDKDGSLAGALWYLHFRLVDRAPDEKAREDAERLGFKKDHSDPHLKMWLAVQNLLKDLNP